MLEGEREREREYVSDKILHSFTWCKPQKIKAMIFLKNGLSEK